ERIIGRGDRMVLSKIGFTPRAKQVLMLSVDEAWRLGHAHVGTEHLLLGLIREDQSIACGILESLGVGMEAVRAQTLQALRAKEEMPLADADAPHTQQEQTPRHSPPPSAQGQSVHVSDSARRVLSFSQDESLRLNHDCIGTEHLLLGLLRENGRM